MSHERGRNGQCIDCTKALDAGACSVCQVCGHFIADDLGHDCVKDDRPASADASMVAHDAHQAVYGSRQHNYGHPSEDFTRTAGIWTALLGHKLRDGAAIEADDIARCMIGVKLSRDVHSPKRDNRVDMAGYAITLDRLETGS